MTKEEAAHLSEVLKAYSKDKEIEYLNMDDKWVPKCTTNFDANPFKYRIKPKYRPYNSAEEFLKAQEEHGNMLYNRTNGEYHHPVQVRNGGINVMYENNTIYHTFAELLKSTYNYTWQDGTPCGVKDDSLITVNLSDL